MPFDFMLYCLYNKTMWENQGTSCILDFLCLFVGMGTAEKIRDMKEQANGEDNTGIY